MLFCPTCGTKCEDGARFCGNCGTNLEGIAGVPETMMPREGGGTDSGSTDSGGAAGSAEEPWKSENTGSACSLLTCFLLLLHLLHLRRTQRSR